MFATKKIKLMAVVAVAATALVMNSCGKKQTTSPAQAAATGGFVTVTTPATELEGIKRDLEGKNMPCGIGIGESNDEMIARTIAADNARAVLATSMEATVQRLSESYAQNVNNEAKKIWEEATRTLTNQQLRGTNVFKEVAQFDPGSGNYKIYVLMVLNPAIFKDAIAAAMSQNEEFELRVKKDDMMSKLDANIAEYESKYKR